MVKQLVTINKEAALIQQKIADIEQWLESASSSQLKDACQWAKEAQAISKLRAGMEEIFCIAKRLEAKILRKLAIAEAWDVVDQKDMLIAKWFASLNDEDFRAFTEWVNDNLLLRSNVRDYRRYLEEQKNIENRRVGARAGYAQSFKPEISGSVRTHATELMKSLIRGERARTVGDIVVDIAEELSLDADDEVIKTGLEEIVRKAVANSQETDNFICTHWGASKEYRCGYIPAVVTYQDDDGWMRVPWRIASMRQLLFMVELREHQYRELKSAAKTLRDVYEILVTIAKDNNIQDTDVCSELLQIGRVNGYVHGVAPEDKSATLTLTKMRSEFSYGFGESSFASLEQNLISHGIHTEQELMELSQEELNIIADKLFTGENRKTMEYFSAAYNPSMIGKYASTWEMPLNWGSTGRPNE